MNHDAREVANVMIEKGLKSGNPLTPLQIIKLTYLCQAWMLGMFEKAMFRQEVQAWEHGPVIPDVYHKVKRYGDKPVKKQIAGVGSETFTDDEEHILNEVYEVYGHWTGFQLSSLTHRPGTPWYKTKKKQPLGRGEVIHRDMMQKHYAKKLEQAAEEGAA